MLKIFRILKEAQNEGDGYLNISEIARRAGLHRWTVSRTIDLWMSCIAEIIIPEELEQVGLGDSEGSFNCQVDLSGSM